MGMLWDPGSVVNWLFVDMNSYFASVEQHLRPELRGRAVAVVPVMADGTCVIAASHEAKRHGVKTGTRVGEAKRMCPGIVLVQARPTVYVEVHHAVSRTIEKSAPIHKAYSIDEWAIRLMGRERSNDVAMELGRSIKRDIAKDFSPWLSCSIGLAPSRLLAKIASDLKKPDGLTILHVHDLPAALEHCKLDDFAGIARATLGRLNAAGVHTVRELWNISRIEARRIWGSVQGEMWWLGFHGYDMPEAGTQRRSIMHASMLAPEHRHDAGAHGVLVRLLSNGARRLRVYEKRMAYRLHIDVNSYTGRTWSVQAPLEGTQDTLTIVRAFEALWRTRPWAPGREAESTWQPFAKVSMTLSGLVAEADAPMTLFADPKPLRALSEAMDRIDQRWGRHTVYLGSVHDYRHRMEDKIAFGRIPDDPVR